MAHACLTEQVKHVRDLPSVKLMDLPVLQILNPLPYQANR